VYTIGPPRGQNGNSGSTHWIPGYSGVRPGVQGACARHRAAGRNHEFHHA
jgi:hypothetical protein